MTFNGQSIMDQTCGIFEFRNNSSDPLNSIKLFTQKKGTNVTFKKHFIQTFQFGNNLMAIIMRYAESFKDNKPVSYLGFSHGTMRGYEKQKKTRFEKKTQHVISF